MRPLLALAAGTIVILLLPLPEGGWSLAVHGTWAGLLGLAALWQLGRLLAHNRHVFGSWLGLRPARAAPGYVRNLFDSYAWHYDEHLFGELDYRGPNLVRGAIGHRLDDRAGTLAIADLGCGTGACGPLFGRLAGRLVGVDLSREMLQRAWARDVYDELHQRDLVAFLRRHPEAFDLLIAADVMVYHGDLAPIFAGAAIALRKGGLFTFTVESSDRDDFVAQRTGRFSHGRAYVLRAAAAAGLLVVEVIRAPLRREGDRMIAADVWLLQRRFADANPHFSN
jgi:predicted TPR repeat methyltransferase